MSQTNLFLQGISLETFQELISQAVREEFKQHQPVILKQEIVQDEWLSKKEAAKILKLSLPTIMKMVKEGKIPCSRIGNNIRFKRSSLEKSFTDVRSKDYKMSVVRAS